MSPGKEQRPRLGTESVDQSIADGDKTSVTQTADGSRVSRCWCVQMRRPASCEPPRSWCAQRCGRCSVCARGRYLAANGIADFAGVTR